MLILTDIFNRGFCFQKMQLKLLHSGIIRDVVNTAVARPSQDKDVYHQDHDHSWQDHDQGHLVASCKQIYPLTYCTHFCQIKQ